jgi:hypothetical protein
MRHECIRGTVWGICARREKEMKAPEERRGWKNV